MYALDIIDRVVSNIEKQKMIKPIAVFSSIVFTTVFIHWLLVQIYATYCSAMGLFGFMYTFITLGSPTCHFINLLQFELAKHYITIWMGAGASIMTWILSNK